LRKRRLGNQLSKVVLRPPVDAPPNSLKDPNVVPRTKQQKKKKIGACSLIHNISRVGGCVGASG